MKINPALIKRILVIKLRAVGDVLLSTIVLRNLRLGFPGARIDFLTEPPARDILASSPDVDGIEIFDRSSMSGLDLIRHIRGNRYDLVIDLFGNPRTALVTRLSGASHRVGFRFRGRTYAYNIVVEPRGGLVHNTQFNLDAIEAIGVEIQDRNVYFHFAPSDEAYVDGFLSSLSDKFVVALNSGGGWYTKRWSLERFAELGDRMAEEFGATIILTWGPGQRDEAKQVAGLMKQTPVLPPATTLPQLGVLLKRASLVVTNDSGPMHIGAAVGTPVLGIYGPTNPALQGPYGTQHSVVRKEGLDCLGCNMTTCPIGHPCMKELTVDVVLQAVRDLIRKNRLIS
jgi:heptosyltransferase III